MSEEKSVEDATSRKRAYANEWRSSKSQLNPPKPRPVCDAHAHRINRRHVDAPKRNASDDRCRS